jgi:hypothetical protein
VGRVALGILCFLLVATGEATAAPPSRSAARAEQSTLQCAANVPVYRITTNGDMYLYHHTEPENGEDLAFLPNPPKIGSGWNLGRPVAGLDGVVYMAWNDGALRRYRWNGSSWDIFGGAQFEVIDPAGWARYLTADYRNRITVDTLGHIYTVEPDGNLHWRSYDAATDTMSHRVISGGWSQYNLIAAGGPGVIYARNSSGVLFRYRYHAGSQRWLMVGRQVGSTWNIFDRVFSAGGDVLYAVQPNGRMDWYRWDENTEAWVSNVGRIVGGGWFDWATTAVPNSCRRVGTSAPTRPAVPAQPDGPVTLSPASDGSFHYSYVDGEGRAVHAEVSDLSGGTPISFAAVPGLAGVTATTGLAEYQDGRLVLTANGTDAEMRSSVRTTDDLWAGATTDGGYLASPPALVRQTDNRITVFALDSDHALWVRRQVTVNGPLGGWTRIGDTPLGLGRLSLATTTSGVRLIGLGRDGAFRTAVFENGALGPWTSLGGGSFQGAASVVTMPDGTLQVFATDAAGTVQTQRQTNGGFPGTWIAVPGVTAAGSPSAVLAPSGTLQIVVRADDGYVYHSRQVAPGSSEYAPWSEVTGYAEQAVTDPTALDVPSEGTWVIAFVNDVRSPKLFRAQPGTARSARSFAELSTA